MAKIITEGLPIDMGLGKITSLGAPVAPDDAARLQDVQVGPISSVVNIAALTGTSITALADGSLRFINTVRDYFRLEKTSTLTADGITILTASGGTGRWIRLGIPDPYWITQTTWYWDPVAGNDENTGAVGSPFLTHEELYRRTNGTRFASGIVINILDNIPDQVFRIGYESSGTSTYQSPLIEVGSGTITALTALDFATNQPWELTDSAIPTSWTASGFVDKLLVARNGSGTVVGTAWVDKDLGSNTARMAGPTIAEPLLAAGATTAVNDFSTTSGTFSVGNTYKIYDFKTCAAPRISLQSAISLTVYGLRSTGTFAVVNEVGVRQILLSRCKFSSSVSFNGRAGAYQCLSSTTTGISHSWSNFFNCSFHGLCQVSSSPSFGLIGVTFVSNGASLRITHGSYSGGLGPLPDIGLFDCTAANFVVDHQSFFQVGRIWGKSNTNVGSHLVSIGVGSWIYSVLLPTVLSGEPTADFRIIDANYLWTDIGSTAVIDSRNAGLVLGAS